MDDEQPQVVQDSGTGLAGGQPRGCGFWALWVLALAAAGAVSYWIGSILLFSNYVLPPTSLMIFGLLAGMIYGYALEAQYPTRRKWIQASGLAGLVAGLLSILPTGLAARTVGVYAAWAYGWAAYGAAFGVIVQRTWPDRRWMLPMLSGWAVAGIVAGVVGALSDVMRISGTTQVLLQLASSRSRVWSLQHVILVGAVCGATGGAITAIGLARNMRPAPSETPVRAALTDNESKLVRLAGIIGGIAAAALCTYVAPLLVTILLQGSLESLELTVWFLNMLAGSALCIPTYAVVCVPLSMGLARLGAEMAHARGRTDIRSAVWVGAALGGMIGYVLGSFVAFAIGQLD